MGVGYINERYFAANGYICSLSQGSEGDFLPPRRRLRKYAANSGTLEHTPVFRQ